MMLLILLAIPLVVAGAGIALSKGRFNWLEASIQAVVGLALMGGGYMVARYAKTVDTEIWNGRIAAKDAGTQGCCHSYSCNCIPVCSSDSNGNQTCVDVCSTCYEHDHDVYWSASTTNGESVFSDTCNPPGTQAPEAWERIRMGEPTAIEHTYINYIKGLPGKFFRRPWLVERYRSRLPSYPRVRGYSASRFLTSLGESLPDSEVLEQGLAELNADLGKARQVNIIVVVVGDESPEYADALAEAWLGGKKNDLIVVVGVPENLRVGWAKVVSWTDARGVRDGIEQRVAGMGNFNGGKLLSIIRDEAGSKFQRKHMRDFRYLLKEIEPPGWAFGLLVGLGLLVSCGIQAYFWVKDPFNKDKSSGQRRKG